MNIKETVTKMIPKEILEKIADDDRETTMEKIAKSIASNKAVAEKIEKAETLSAELKALILAEIKKVTAAVSKKEAAGMGTFSGGSRKNQ